MLAPNLDANFEGGGPFGAVAMNSNLAKATAASVVALALWLRRRKLDLVMIGCGGLSGLAAISGPCGFVNAAAAAVIGGMAGIVFMASAHFWNVAASTTSFVSFQHLAPEGCGE